MQQHRAEFPTSMPGNLSIRWCLVVLPEVAAAQSVVRLPDWLSEARANDERHIDRERANSIFLTLTHRHRALIDHV